MRISFFLVLLLAFVTTDSFAQWTSGRPDGHAPIGVMGDHTHGGGEFMISYRYMYMNMSGNRDGSDRISADEVVSPEGQNFLISPTEMPMGMHMFGVMYAPTNQLTLMAMIPVLSSEMDHITRAGGAFTTSSSGLGDIKLTALYNVAKFGNSRVHLHGGVAFPTGSIESSDVTPASAPNETQLPYPMQLGSGTVDLLPGVTYLGQTMDWSWGIQARGTIRLGENDQDYALGNRFLFTTWGARKLTPWISASLRLEANSWEDVSGASPAFAGPVNMRMVPTVFTDLRGGSRFDAGLGLNTTVNQGALKGLRFAVEGMVPVAQNLDGPQLETDWQIIAGLQYAF